MIIYIKNMVCLRCVLKVQSELEQLGITDAIVQLGRVELSRSVSDDQMEQLRIALSTCGLEVMPKRNAKLVEQIKETIGDMLDEPIDKQIRSHSEYISEKLGKNYAHLAGIFAEVTGISIGQFVIRFRVERTQQMIRQNVLSLSEIAFRLNYSSIGHLSNQFKQSTGISPSVYRQIARKELSESFVDSRLMRNITPHIILPASLKSIRRQSFTVKKVTTTYKFLKL